MKKFFNSVKDFIFKYAIGFRSKNKNKMILAGIYYIFALLIAISSGESFLFTLVFLFSLPFAIFSIIDAVKAKSSKNLITLPVCFAILVATSIVAPPTIEPEEISLSYSQIILEDINKTEQIDFTLKPENASSSGIRIISENPDIVSVDGNTIQAMSPGETNVYAELETGKLKSKKIPVIVKDKLAEDAKVIIEQIEKIGDVTLESGDSIQSAKDVYDAASPEVQAKVTNYTTLSDADIKYQQLKKEEEDRIKKEEEEKAKKEAEELARQEAQAQEQEQQQQSTKTENQNATYENSDSSNGRTVYVGKTGNKYHTQNCRTLKGNGRAISLSEARAQGRDACGVCGG